MSQNIDLAGNTLICESVRVGATTPGTTGTDISGSELTVLDSVTAGTVTASKAVVVDSNKDIAAFRTLTGNTLHAGLSGTAGAIRVYPTTASKGDLKFTCNDQTGNTEVTVTAGAMGQTTAVTIPDPGGATANFVLSTGTSTATTATSTELNALAGATNANSGTGKAMITGTSGALTVAGALTGVSASYTGQETARSGTATPAAASAVKAFAMGSAGVGIYWGTGSPNTALTAPKGSLYLTTDGSSSSTRAYINTDGSTAWTNITTAG